MITEVAILRKCTRLPFGLAVIARTIVLALIGVSMLILFHAVVTGSMAAFVSDKRRLLVTVVLTPVISFLGDTVNTAARILDMCKDKGRSLLISDEVARRIPAPSRYELQPIADISLRGKERSIGLYAVEDTAE